jgi:hypothetical protein
MTKADFITDGLRFSAGSSLRLQYIRISLADHKNLMIQVGLFDRSRTAGKIRVMDVPIDLQPGIGRSLWER